MDASRRRLFAVSVVAVAVVGLVLGVVAPPFAGRASAAAASHASHAGRSAVAGAARVSTVRAATATPAAGGQYVPLPAVRLVDTRTGLGGVSGPLGAGQTVSFRVLGVGGVPASGVSVVTLNLTGLSASSLTYLTAFPAGSARPSGTSSLNVNTGGTANNLAFVPVGSNGLVSVFNNAGTVGLAVDVEGYVTDATSTAGQSTFMPVPLTRFVDTRSGLGVRTGKVGAGQTVTVTPGGSGGVPSSGVTAVAVNVVAAGPSASTF